MTVLLVSKCESGNTERFTNKLCAELKTLKLYSAKTKRPLPSIGPVITGCWERWTGHSPKNLPRKSVFIISSKPHMEALAYGTFLLILNLFSRTFCYSVGPTHCEVPDRRKSN